MQTQAVLLFEEKILVLNEEKVYPFRNVKTSGSFMSSRKE